MTTITAFCGNSAKLSNTTNDMEDRETRFRTDVARLLSVCEDCKYLRVNNFADETLQLELLNPSDKEADIELSFSFSARDYPEGTVLSRISKAEAFTGTIQPPIVTETKSILNLVATECNDFCKANDLLAPSFVEQFLKDTDRGKTTPTFISQVSQATSCHTEGDGSDMDDYDNYDGFDYVEGTNKVLELEIARVHQIFGENSLESREFAGIDEVDLLFFIDMNNLLDRNTASGWGVNLETPLVILLHIQSSSKYLDGVEPQVDVFQESFKNPGEKKKAGVGLQMKKIVEKFINRHWKELTNARMEEMLATSKQSSPYLQVKQSEPGIQRQASLGAQISLEQSDQTSVHSLDDGFLTMLFRFVLNRILSLNEYCVICDEKHVLETGLIKPCVCTRDLCVFAFQTLGVMADAAESIAADANVVDLLIAMANAAACSPRNIDILDPYPSIVDPDNLDRLALDPNNLNFPLVKEVLQDIVGYRQQIVKGIPMDEARRNHKLSFPLMQWIIATCRAHIVLLPESRRLQSMRTQYQFLLISSPPKKEAAFRSAKEKHGSQFAFHGSSIENWHSILRKGLINATGSKLQLHGAAHGSGVYLSPRSNVSFSYSGYTAQGNRSEVCDGCLVGKVNLKCIALCEVVTSKELRKCGDIWVMPDSEKVCTRFFFVYDNNTSIQVATNAASFRKEIDHAMAYITSMRQR